MSEKADENLPRLAVISRETGESRYYRNQYGENILGVTAPESLDQLRELLKEAAKGNFSLHVHGQNPTGNQQYDNVVIVDLKNLNQVLEVNTRSAYALIEPGVTYKQLYEYLESNNTGLWIDCDRNQLNSVSDSIANHEFGYTPYGDHMMMQCGMEVMLADGELVRTTMGALPGNNIWQLFKWGYGPWVDPIFTQSTLGIITKIGLWLMPAPPAYKPFMLSMPNQSDIIAAVEILRDLKINVIVPNSVVISNPLLDAIPYIKREDYSGSQAPDMNKLKADLSLGEWNLYAALYNTPDNVELLWPMVSEALSSIEGARLFTDDDRKGDQIWMSREGLMRGRPADGFDNLNHWRGRYRFDLGIACPPDGKEALQLTRIITGVLETHGFDDLSEFVVGWRSMIKRNYILFDAEEKLQVERCINEIIGKVREKGYGITHARSNYHDVLVNSELPEGMARLGGLLKDALDPQKTLL
ncbi:MAG: FAD-binding protein [Gammaproteobacteria bacterium]|nr:FAD-binding protein [Gammaproteobacteria bacterium]